MQSRRECSHCSEAGLHAWIFPSPALSHQEPYNDLKNMYLRVIALYCEDKYPDGCHLQHTHRKRTPVMQVNVFIMSRFGENILTFLSLSCRESYKGLR